MPFAFVVTKASNIVAAVLAANSRTAIFHGYGDNFRTAEFGLDPQSPSLFSAACHRIDSVLRHVENNFQQLAFMTHDERQFRCQSRARR